MRNWLFRKDKEDFCAGCWNRRKHFGIQRRRQKHFKNIFPFKEGMKKSSVLKNRKIFFDTLLFSSGQLRTFHKFK